MKTKIFAGNWKMNKNVAEAESFCRQLLSKVPRCDEKVLLFVPFTDIAACVKLCAGSYIEIGAQNVHWATEGAYTGEISADMLLDAGVRYTLIGHSERRSYFGETDETVYMKTKAALNAGMTAVVCVGETLEQRQSGETEAVLKRQLASLSEIPADEFGRVILAYEPVWAIGTGVNATARQAEDTIRFIRSETRKLQGKIAADRLKLLYGGSMNERNAAELLSMPNIDGGLIGGASLDPAKFAAIINTKENSGG